jgi:hypothetical protein
MGGSAAQTLKPPSGAQVAAFRADAESASPEADIGREMRAW